METFTTAAAAPTSRRPAAAPRTARCHCCCATIGVRGLTKQMALELAPHDIRVLGVAPTFCVTEGNLEAMAANPNPNPGADIPAILGSRLGRVGVPDDIARVVLFCASDLAAFMTGSTLLADAGETI